MRLWHLEPDTPRRPRRASPGEPVDLVIGTWPIHPGQSVFASFQVTGADGLVTNEVRQARWLQNQGENSYWGVELGRFRRGDRIRYRVFGDGPDGAAAADGDFELTVGPKLHVALLWHQHQPLYRELDAAARGAYREPWVRLHALRDYFGMAELLGKHPRVHASINLTPVLLWQIDDYVERGATDRALELTLRPSDRLTAAEQDEVLQRFFDASLQRQILVHPRYAELYERRRRGLPFGPSELRDLQMWFNLAWFGVELREGAVELPGGERVSVARWVQKDHDYSQADLEEMVAVQRSLLAAVVPAHRRLQDAGRLELLTTPFFHPILPLLIDSDSAVLDRRGTSLPMRYAHPEDAEMQVRWAAEDYARRFGRPPRGMWPAEGALSEAAARCLSRNGIRFVATDRGVLARSGRFGYRVDDPDVLCQPYRLEHDSLSIFFRDTALSDQIGFSCHRDPSPANAAGELVTRIKERFARRVSGDRPRVLTLALDGENPWGSYADDGRPFLSALYSSLANDPELETVTFSEVLAGAPDRSMPAWPEHEQAVVHELWTGSWADETDSAPGVDLGTWIGEGEENRAWELLGDARRALNAASQTPERNPRAFEALYAAQGSDWFWWYGADQDSGHDEDFDGLFRAHLRAAYRRAGLPVPSELSRAIVQAVVTWSSALPEPHLDWGARLAVRTHCPGTLVWRASDGWQEKPLAPVGGAMAGIATYVGLLGPFDEDVDQLVFKFRCASRACAREQEPCAGGEHRVEVGAPREREEE